MKFFRYLFRSSQKLIGIVAVAGLLSGAFSAGLIAIINGALHANSSDYTLYSLGFVVFFLGKLGTYILSKAFIIRFSEEKIKELRHQISELVIHTPLVRLEELGQHRIYAVLTGDVLVLGSAILAVPNLVINAAIVLGCSSYLLWLSPKVFLGIILLVVIGLLGYKILREKAIKAFRSAREKKDRLFNNFRTLTEGIKELKMNPLRVKHFYTDHLHETTCSLAHYNVRGAFQLLIVDSWSQFLFYIMIGYLLFLSPTLSTMPTETLTGFIFAVLYMMNPIFALIGKMSTFVAGQVSLQKIEDLGTTLVGPVSMPSHAPTHETPVVFESLELKSMTFSYPSREGEEIPFQIGPFDFSLRSGELIFIIGGNGSGKSTFVKILTGLYSPQEGQFILNGNEIADMETYRRLFSVVFSPSFVFDHILGQTGSDVDQRAKTFLGQLHLEKKIEIENGKFSTIDVSQGQRKRLAMLSALLENHAIFVFDEWAADQDPHYKKIFYTELLPNLKKQGKAIVVITHDDRYFSLGDRIVKFDYGQIVSHDYVYSPTAP